ncbi:MAG TPA: STAS domain-containing protein [Streptosporangiaceae bacterium]|jgi:anti-sigma B factor antagonist|nr:STAS domain-containing protein [Streptosporangiaceae bacterium]
MDVNARSVTASPLVVPEIVTLPDEIDITNAQSVGDELRAAFGQGVLAVIADMTRTQFCDSSGIRHLLLANDRAAEMNAEFRLVVQAPAVLRAFRLLGIDRLLAVYPSLQAALSNATEKAAEQEAEPTR